MRSGDPLRDQSQARGGVGCAARRDGGEIERRARQRGAHLGQLLAAAALGAELRRRTGVRQLAGARSARGRLDERERVAVVCRMRVRRGCNAGSCREAEQAGEDAPE
jgi:hypothetical protein